MATQALQRKRRRHDRAAGLLGLWLFEAELRACTFWRFDRQAFERTDDAGVPASRSRSHHRRRAVRPAAAPSRWRPRPRSRVRSGRMLRDSIGETTAGTLLAEIPNIDHFESAKAVAAFAGLSPRDRRSGTSIHGRPRLCRTGNSRLRKALYMPAIVARRFNPTLRIFAERLLSAGKHKQLVIGAVMRKLLALAYGILRSGVAFDANYA
ncbi:MAG: transposase [Candidatus Cybelea sp.]